MKAVFFFESRLYIRIVTPALFGCAGAVICRKAMLMRRGNQMATSKKTKKRAKKKTKTKSMRQIEEYISCLRELHKLQGSLLKELDKCVSKRGLKD